jgi:hypothetical protein
MPGSRYLLCTFAPDLPSASLRKVKGTESLPSSDPKTIKIIHPTLKILPNPAKTVEYTDIPTDAQRYNCGLGIPDSRFQLHQCPKAHLVDACAPGFASLGSARCPAGAATNSLTLPDSSRNPKDHLFGLAYKTRQWLGRLLQAVRLKSQDLANSTKPAVLRQSVGS